MTNQINLACIYDMEEDEITIIGETAPLESLVKNLNRGQSKSFFLSSNTLSNFSGQSLKQLKIKITSGKIVIGSEDNKITISGSRQALCLLSTSISNLYAPKVPSKFSSKHSHIEYFPEHPYLASISLSMIVHLVTAPN